MRLLKVAVSSALVCAGTAGGILLAQAPERAKGVKFAQINAEEMKEWLGYLASDDLQGRQTFTEGYGLAASYIAGLSEAVGREATRRERHATSKAFASEATRSPATRR